MPYINLHHLTGRVSKSILCQHFHEEVSKTDTNERYLWSGLDLEHFEVIHILPQDKNNAAIIMYDKRPDSVKPWCVEFMGGGHYFSAVTELMAYCHSRRWTYKKMI